MISDTEELDWPSRKRNKFVASLFLPAGRRGRIFRLLCRFEEMGNFYEKLCPRSPLIV